MVDDIFWFQSTRHARLKRPTIVPCMLENVAFHEKCVANGDEGTRIGPPKNAQPSTTNRRHNKKNSKLHGLAIVERSHSPYTIHPFTVTFIWLFLYLIDSLCRFRALCFLYCSKLRLYAQCIKVCARLFSCHRFGMFALWLRASQRPYSLQTANIFQSARPRDVATIMTSEENSMLIKTLGQKHWKHAKRRQQKCHPHICTAFESQAKKNNDSRRQFVWSYRNISDT